MKERPIMFSAPMVRAILDGRKTMTRRTSDRWGKLQPGDLLWVKEKFGGIDPHWHYAATSDLSGPWKSPLFMPRAASRITLEVTDVRSERLLDISNTDAVSEGFSHRDEFFRTWVQLKGQDSFFDNPLVWVISFKPLGGENETTKRFECQKMSPECPYYGEGAIVNGMPMCTHCYIDMGLYGVFYLVCGDRRAQAERTMTAV